MLRRTIYIVVYLTFLAIYIYWFAIFFTDLSWFAQYVDTTAWSFGQVVAITVWAQPLCEYFYLELRTSRPLPQTIIASDDDLTAYLLPPLSFWKGGLVQSPLRYS